jgi:hypothetical protein
MAKYIILNMIPEEESEGVENITKSEVSKALENECPGTEWLGRYRIRCPYNTLDIIKTNRKQIDRVREVFKKFYKTSIDIKGNKSWEEFVLSIS